MLEQTDIPVKVWNKNLAPVVIASAARQSLCFSVYQDEIASSLCSSQ
jgi:hypothetical protein